MHNLQDDHLRELDEFLTRIKSQDKELTHLDLSNMCLGVRGAQLAAEPLARARYLRSLNLSYNDLGNPHKKKNRVPVKKGETGIPFLADGLARNMTLTELNLAGNNLGAEGVHAVATVLKTHSALKTLSLFNNYINDLAVEDLTEALLQNPRLTKLNLDYNDISDKGAEMLKQLCLTNRSLVELSLRDNDCISERLLQEIADCLIRNRQLQDEELAIIREQERVERMRQDAEEEDRQKREKELRAERERIEREYHEMENRRAEEEEKRREVEGKELEQAARQKARKNAKQAAHEEHISNLVNLAYEWRATLRGGERRGREWRSGFTAYKDIDDTSKDNFVNGDIPKVKRLVACWCEPTEQTVQYSGTLHYHCMNEPGPGDQLMDDSNHRYEGCKGTAHKCRSAPIAAQPDRNQNQLFAPNQSADSM